jgi:hypothetical protein
LDNAKEMENKRHQERIVKIDREHEAKIFDLTNGLTPREPKFVVAEWKMPDTDYLACFMNIEESNETSVKPDLKWQMPVKWRSLKLNIREQDVLEILGVPDEKINSEGKFVFRYGRLGEYGILEFEICPDSVNRLRYWKEPMWAYVKQEFQNQKILNENESEITTVKK